MAKDVGLKVFLLGRSELVKENVDEWIKYLGATQYVLPEGTSGELFSLVSSKRCYRSFEPELNLNVKKVRKSIKSTIDNLKLHGHYSVLEHCMYMFGLEGISVKLTGELNRHRHIAISQESKRYVRDRELYYIYSNIFKLEDKQLNVFDIEDLETKKRLHKVIVEDTMNYLESQYNRMCNLWKIDDINDFNLVKMLTSGFRDIYPTSTATGGVWSFNLRSLRDILKLRSNKHVEHEFVNLASNLIDLMIEQEPIIFDDFYKNEEGYWERK